MNNRTFDVFARRTASVLGRRSLLGLVTGTLLAGASSPAAACGPHHSCPGGKGGKGKKDGKHDGKKDGKGGKDPCKQNAKKCRNTVVRYCALYYPDPYIFASCYSSFDGACCVPLSNCKTPAEICF